MIFIDGQIKWYVCWYPINYTKSLKIREEKEIEFKKLQFLKNDIDSVKVKKYKKNCFYEKLTEIIIPNEVKNYQSISMN